MPAKHQAAKPKRIWAILAGALTAIVGLILLSELTPIDNMLVHTAPNRTSAKSLRPDTFALPGRTWKPHTTPADFRAHVVLSVLQQTAGTSDAIVNALSHGQGFALRVATTSIITTIGTDRKILSPDQFVVVPKIAMRSRYIVTIAIYRSQSLRIIVTGVTVNSFTYNVPLWRPIPAEVAISHAKSASIQSIDLTRTSLIPDGIVVSFFIRAGQILGGAAIVIGIWLMLRQMRRRHSQKPNRRLVKLLFGTIGIGTSANIIVAALHLQSAASPYLPRNSWLFSQYPRFNDYFQIYESLRSLNPYGPRYGTYPPFGYWVIAPFVLLQEYASLIVFLLTMLTFFAWWIYTHFAESDSHMANIIVIAVALLSLPVTFAVDRGNIDLVIFVLLAIAVAYEERRRSSGVASVIIGVAAAAKIFPAIFLAGVFRNRRFKPVVLATSAALIVTCGALVSYHGGALANLHALRRNSHILAVQLQSAPATTYFNSSLYASVQAIALAAFGPTASQSVHAFLVPIMTPIEIIMGALTVVYVVARERELWRVNMLAALVVLLFSELSNYYALLILFLPLASFVRTQRKTRRVALIAITAGFALSPHAWFYIGNATDVSVLFEAPVLLWLLVLVIVDGKTARRRQANEKLGDMRCGYPVLSETT